MCYIQQRLFIYLNYVNDDFIIAMHEQNGGNCVYLYIFENISYMSCRSANEI